MLSSLARVKKELIRVVQVIIWRNSPRIDNDSKRKTIHWSVVFPWNAPLHRLDWSCGLSDIIFSGAYFPLCGVDEAIVYAKGTEGGTAVELGRAVVVMGAKREPTGHNIQFNGRFQEPRIENVNILRVGQVFSGYQRLANDKRCSRRSGKQMTPTADRRVNLCITCMESRTDLL